MKLKSTTLLMFVGMLLFSCSKDKDDKSTTGILTGTVTEYSSSENLSDVRIIVYDANTNSPTNFSDLTDTEGTYSFELESGVYYLKLSKQGYNDIPVPGFSAVTVTVEVDNELTSNYQMQPSTVTNSGYISGVVTSEGNAVSGVLVVAGDGTSGYSSVSDVNGKYYIYNVPAGNYSLNAYIAGYNSVETDVTVSADTESKDNDFELTSGASGSLLGMITFLATSNGEVDVTLTNPLTNETIPGLATTTIGAEYTLSNIPNGTYIARATYKNDGYVVDPDWIIKNGETTVSIENNTLSLDFSVTGAVEINSPVSDVETAKPVVISEAIPTFSWTDYSSVSDYIIEVSDVNGNVIWGGFSEESGTITKNIIIPKSQTSIKYNSDSNATEELKTGNTYRWKIYASKDDAKEAIGWKLISASEEQMGLFTIE